MNPGDKVKVLYTDAIGKTYEWTGTLDHQLADGDWMVTLNEPKLNIRFPEKDLTTS